MPSVHDEALVLALCVGLEVIRRRGGEQMNPHIFSIKTQLRTLDARLVKRCKDEAYTLVDKLQG